MRKQQIKWLLILLIAAFSINRASASTSHHSSNSSAMDASAMLGFYSPGTGIAGAVAFRILDDVLKEADDTMSFETGLGIISVYDSVYGNSYSLTVFEIPFMARWDIHIPNSKFTVGPEAGFVYLSGGTVTINGNTYTTRGGNLYLQIGGNGFYAVSDSLRLRLSLDFGGFTNIMFGVNFLL